MHATPFLAHIQAPVAAGPRRVLQGTRPRNSGIPVQLSQRHGSVAAAATIPSRELCAWR